MRATSTSWLIGFAVFALLLPACDKESPCLQEEAFCSLVNAQDFDGTGPVINEFLKTFNANDPQALDELVEWLECKRCVRSAIIVCNSCIYTLPPQSQIEVTFIQDSDSTILIMDIVMDNPLRFVGYH
jgi:hypothetical protein